MSHASVRILSGQNGTSREYTGSSMSAGNGAEQHKKPILKGRLN